MEKREDELTILYEDKERIRELEVDRQLNDIGVFILAGGKGSRLKKSEDLDLQRLPKPLVQIDSANGQLTMLDNTLQGIFAAGMTDVTLLTSNDPESQGDLVENYAGGQYRDKIQFIREDQPLGTAGAVFNALQYTEHSTVAVTPVDTLFPFEYLPQILREHKATTRGLTWVVTTSPGENAQNIGRILVNPENKRIIHALENQPNVGINLYQDILIPCTSVGVVIANREFFLLNYQAFIMESERGDKVDLYRQVIPWLLSKDIPIGTFDIGQPAPDLGTPDRLKQFGRNR